jgi:hypothetical protein
MTVESKLYVACPGASSGLLKFVNLEGELHKEKTDHADTRHGVRIHWRDLRPGDPKEERKAPKKKEDS